MSSGRELRGSRRLRLFVVGILVAPNKRHDPIGRQGPRSGKMGHIGTADEPWWPMITSLAFLMVCAAQNRVEVAAYYFPGYHADPRIKARKGAGWTEWDLTRAAKPRFK